MSDLFSYLQVGREAAWGPIRSLGDNVISVQEDAIRPIQFQDFAHALEVIKKSVPPSILENYEKWNKEFGCQG
jgi:SpoVK/Ycf46/Vps4 family AAA+-type ATPase